jgi:hypothetical protein
MVPVFSGPGRENRKFWEGIFVGSPSSTVWEEKNQNSAAETYSEHPSKVPFFNRLGGENQKPREGTWSPSPTKKKFLNRCSRMVSSGGAQAVI